jgi:drug/metabolite transporter (DMT)-like permease
MAVFIGVVVAACFGSGDFFGGLASRRASTLAVLGIAQLIAVVGAVAAALLFTGSPSGRDLGFGAAAGALNVVGLGLLYQGLSLGRMGIVAPMTAVVAACIPVGYGLLTGEDPSTLALIGVAFAIVAGGLIAHEHDREEGGALQALGLAIGSGLFFGWSFVLYAETDDGSGFWPVLTGRAAAVVIIVLGLLVTQTGLVLARRELRTAAAAGALDVLATVLLLVAVREGLSSLVAPIAALGPAFTAGWAWGLLHEPVARLQLVGLGLALAGLSLIAVG